MHVIDLEKITTIQLLVASRNMGILNCQELSFV